MQVMKSMELDDEEKYDAPAVAAQKPDYPWGLRISLSEKEFARLGLDPMDAEIDGIVHLAAMARITSVSHSDSGSGPCCRVEMQIESMAIESEDEENDEGES